jgi:hypothetical protein
MKDFTLTACLVVHQSQPSRNMGSLDQGGGITLPYARQ